MRERITNLEAVNNVSLHILPADQCNRIFGMSKRLLSKYGWKLKNDTEGMVHKKLQEAGCTFDGDRAFFSEEVIHNALAKAAREVVIYDQHGEPYLRMMADHSKTYSSIAPSPTFCTTLGTQQRHIATKEDAFNAGLLCEALDCVDMACGLAFVSDCPDDLAASYEIRELLRATNKPIQVWGTNRKDYATCIEMCELVAGGKQEFHEKPFAATFTFNDCDFLMDILNSGVMLYAQSANIRGLNAPVTIAGFLAQGLAENLAILTLAEQVQPGYPFLGNIMFSDINFNNMKVRTTSPLDPLVNIAATDLFRFVGLPSYVSAPGSTNAQIFDQQAALDYTMQLYTSKLAGVALNSFGHIDNASTGSLESIVYANELMAYTNSVIAGIEVDDDSLAEDLIADAWPDGNYFSSDHMLENFTTWDSPLFTLQDFDKWKEDGSHDVFDGSARIAKNIIEAGILKPKETLLLHEIDALLKT
jgi:trimethylamine--corrinoid protein Co-methyltransferase